MSPPADKASKVNGEAPQQRKRRISDEDSSSPFKKKAKRESEAIPLTNISGVNAVVGSGSVSSKANNAPIVSENQPGQLATSSTATTSILVPNSSMPLQIGVPGVSGLPSGAASQLVQAVTNGVNVLSHDPESNGSMDIGPLTRTQETQPLTSSNANNGFSSTSSDEPRPYTPITTSNAQFQQPTSPTRVHKDITRPGFPGPGILATPPGAIFPPPPSSLGYSPTKQPSPPSAKPFQSPNGTIPGTSVLPPSIMGISSTKNPPPIGELMANAGTLGGTLIIPPGPTLSPKPPKINLTPPSKKLTSAPAPPPEQLQMNGHHNG